MPPSISVREGIRFLPEPFYEPTRTVVLTSPENRFVDIRILKPHKDAVDEEVEAADYLPIDRLDWAFAGTSTSTISQSAENGLIAHAKWSHWVDSRHFDAEKVSDEGDMYAMADGRTLEKGSMVNPATGVEGAYEEIWRDVEIAGVGQGKGKDRAADAGAQGDEQHQHDSKRPYAVLVLQNDDIPARGMVVQLGQHCQGVLRLKEHISLERWAWGAGKGWTRKVSMGQCLVPCGISTEWEKLPEVGGSVEFEDFRWEVVEKGEL